MQEWYGVQSHGVGGVRVMAHTREQARERIKTQLSLPGRSWYLNQWASSGCMVANREEKQELRELASRLSRLLHITQQGSEAQDPSSAPSSQEDDHDRRE